MRRKKRTSIFIFLLLPIILPSLSGCEEDNIQKFTVGNTGLPASAFANTAKENTNSELKLDCDNIFLDAVGMYDASHYVSAEKVSTQWLYIDSTRRASIYVDQSKETSAFNCYSGAEYKGRNTGFSKGVTLSLKQDGDYCVLIKHIYRGQAVQVQLRLEPGLGVTGIRGAKNISSQGSIYGKKVRQEYVDSWAVEANDEFYLGYLNRPYSLKAGKVISPTIAEIQNQICDDSVMHERVINPFFSWPDIRLAEDDYRYYHFYER